MSTEQGRALRDEGMERAIEAAREEYRAAFYATVEALAATGTPFTSEDVINAIGLPTGSEGLHRNNAVGALMRAAATRKIIVRHGGTTQSRRATSHAAELTYWIGAAHAPAKEPTLDERKVAILRGFLDVASKRGLESLPVDKVREVIEFGDAP